LALFLPCNLSVCEATVMPVGMCVILTADSVLFSGSTINYSFDHQEKAYGNNMGVMIDGTAVIYSGDENQDGIVDGSDLSDIGNFATLVATGYIPQDINGDGLIDGSDLSIIGNNAVLAIGIVTP